MAFNQNQRDAQEARALVIQHMRDCCHGSRIGAMNPFQQKMKVPGMKWFLALLLFCTPAAAQNVTPAPGVPASGGTFTGTPTFAVPPNGLGSPSTAVNVRAPGQNDDTAHGATTGMYWVNTATGDTYLASSVSAGAAVWIKQPLNYTLPGDLGISGLVAEYGVCKLTNAYAGNALTITRSSDSSTKAIGFVPIAPFVNKNCADVAAAAAFCAGTACRVTTWNDQSGNTRDCAQVTFANAPYLGINTLGNVPTLSFWNSINGSNVLVTIQTYCTMPAGVAFTTPNFAIVVAGQGRNGAGGEFVSIGPNTAHQFDFAYGITNNITTLQAPLPFYGGTASTLAMEQTPAVFIASGNTTNINYWLNETNVTGAKSAVNQAFTAGTIGYEVAGGTPAFGDMSAVMIFNANVNSSRQVLSASLYQLFGIPPQVNMNTWLVDGDSIVNGTGAQALNNFNAIAQKTLQVRLVETGTTGTTCSTINTRYAVTIAPLFPTTGRNKVLFMECGTNDLSAATTGAATWAFIQAYITKAAATGWTVVASTVLPCNGCNETQRGILNADIRAGAIAAGATSVCDIASDPSMGQGGQNTSATYYAVPDDTHPNDNGNSLLVSYVLGCISPLVSR